MQTVLLLGGTGRTGRRVAERLVERGVGLRVIVRSVERLPEHIRGKAGVDVVQADLLALTDSDLRDRVRGCGAVICCLGHTLNFRGIFGRPRNLVVQAVARVCRQIEALRPPTPVKVILMSSVSVNDPAGRSGRRGRLEKALVWALRRILPPAKDNQDAADFLCQVVGTSNPYVEWVAVRPDTLREGDPREYTVHDGLVTSLYAPDTTTRANVAHFMCELALDQRVWEAWRGRLPVIVDSESPQEPQGARGV